MENKIPYKFEAVVDSMEQVTPTISKCRLKIFYKYKNRNCSYITDEFAEQLLKTLPYTPVVGIYNEEEKDFDGHSYYASEARVYGLVPEDPKVEWGTFVDKDGIPRTYSSCEVYFYTERFPITRSIVGKQHSMELNPNSIGGYWKVIGGQEYFVYTEGEFLGLSILGDKVEPCFEGSSFYSKSDNFFDLVKKFGEFMYNGGQQMEENLEAVGAEQSAEQLVESNAEPVEVGAPVDNAVEPVAEPVAEPAAEPMAEPAVEMELTTEPEPAVEENAPVRDFEAEIAEKDEKIVELESRNATLSTELENAQAECKKAKEELELANDECKKTRHALDEANAALAEYVNKEKEAVMAEYSEKVSADTIATIRTNINSFSAEQLEKELLFALKRENPSCFNSNSEIAPSEITLHKAQGMEAILENYKKNQID